MATVEIPRQTGARARERTEELLGALAERVLVLDGATGTGIQARDLSAADFGGPDYEGCNRRGSGWTSSTTRKSQKGLSRAATTAIR